MRRSIAVVSSGWYCMTISPCLAVVKSNDIEIFYRYARSGHFPSSLLSHPSFRQSREDEEGGDGPGCHRTSVRWRAAKARTTPAIIHYLACHQALGARVFLLCQRRGFYLYSCDERQLIHVSGLLQG
jgi:hypothetical protein